MLILHLLSEIIEYFVLKNERMMRKRILLVSVVLLFASAVSAQVEDPLVPSLKSQARQAVVSKPQHETVYVPDGNGGWVHDSEIRYTYDERGNILTVVSDNGTTVTKVESTYDEKGQLVTEVTYRTDEGSDVYKPRMKKEYAYDPEIFDLATSFQFSTITNNEWTLFPGSCYKRVVERNADGNIASVTKQVMGYDGAYADQSKIIFTFGEGQRQPSGYEYLVANNGVLSTYTKYTDMVWDAFTPPLANAYSLSWFMNGNFLKSATIKDDSYGDITLTASRDGDKCFEVWNTYADMASQKQKLRYETVDDNDSFRYYNLIYYNANGDEATDDDLYSGTTMQVDYDAWGNEKVYEECQVSQSGGLETPTILDGVKNEFTYGGPHGEVTETVTYSYNANSKSYELDSKVIAADFVDVTSGISVASNVGNGMPAAKGVYNLQGVKVGDSLDRLPKGVYVVNGKKVLRR